MSCVLFTPLAEFFQLNFALNFALVLTGPVIDTFANGALKFDEIVLRHKISFWFLVFSYSYWFLVLLNPGFQTITKFV